MSLQLRYAALSDVGRVRRDNQDSGYAGPHFLAIADGVGGAARGDIASSAAIEQLRRLDVPPGSDMLGVISEAIHRAHDRIAEIVEESPELEGTSTTVTAAVFDGTQLGIGHVGDSRGYLYRDGAISQLTKDHTFVQSLIDEGRITEDEARVHPHRNLILRAVDGIHEPEPDLFDVEVKLGDRILLCSDGASGSLDNVALARILAEPSIDTVAVQLVREALEAGSSDNVTVVLADVVDGDALAASSTTALSTAPMLVGAAAESPRKGHGRGLLRHRPVDTGELDPVPVDGEAIDPEALRYAPRAPRRFVWLRRLGILVVVAAIIGALGWAGYQWTQTQYYVSDSGDHVAVYQGVQADLPGLTMHRVHELTSIKLSELPQYNAQQVRAGIGADNLSDAKAILTRLEKLTVCPPPPTPTRTPTSKATRKPTRTATPHRTPTAGATRKATPKKPTASATTRPRTATHANCAVTQ